MFKKFINQLQTKLVLAFLFVLLIPTSVIAAYTINLTTNTLIETASDRELKVAESQASIMERSLLKAQSELLTISQNPVTRRLVAALAANEGIEDAAAVESWFIQAILVNEQQTYDSISIIDAAGDEIIRVENQAKETVIVDASVQRNVEQTSYFQRGRALLAGQIYVSSAEFYRHRDHLDSLPHVVIHYATPLYSDDGDVSALLVITAYADPILAAAKSEDIHTNTYVIDSDGHYLYHPDKNKLMGAVLNNGSFNINDEQPTDAPKILKQQRNILLNSEDRPNSLQVIAPIEVPEQYALRWLIIRERTLESILAEATAARSVVFTVAASAMLIAIGVAVLVTQGIVRPVRQLASVSSQIGHGNWDVPLPEINSRDEIGDLAHAFSLMSEELKSIYRNLEDRIAARTSELATVAKVGAATTKLLDPNELLQTVADLTRGSFSLYHVQIYLFDSASQVLKLAVTTSEQAKSRSIQIPLDHPSSVIARTARTRKGLIINDVPNTASKALRLLFPLTQSELTTAMFIGDKLIGVLDVQSDKAHRFTGSDLQLMVILSDQLAVAIENANLFREQLNTAEQLRAVDKLKNQFVANMSHELRTPLNMIINFTEAVTTGMMGEINEQQNEALTHVLESGEHLLSLINDILDMSKIEAGMMQMYIEEVDLNEVVTDMQATGQSLLRNKPVKMLLDKDENLPLLRGDKRRIVQILLNLVSNAAKFTPTGSITIGAHRQMDEVILYVRDTGEGIAEADHELIFESFRQTKSGAQQVSGTGLGLPITRYLVQAHGGRIWVQSKLGAGTTFFVALPIKETNESPEVIGEQALH